MRRGALQDISVDRTRLEAMHLGAEVRVAVGALALHTIQASLGGIDISHASRVHSLRDVSRPCGMVTVTMMTGVATMMTWVATVMTLVTHGHHALRGMVAEVLSIGLFPLQLVLDPLAVRSVANQRKDWANAFNEEHTLRRLGIV
jgi:hypothetical protein